MYLFVCFVISYDISSSDLKFGSQEIEVLECYTASQILEELEKF